MYSVQAYTLIFREVIASACLLEGLPLLIKPVLGMSCAIIHGTWQDGQLSKPYSERLVYFL